MKKNVKAKRELNFEAAVKEANRCLLCEDAPCSNNCPAGTDPGKFIRQIKFENYKGAARTIRKNNILGNVCAHVCPVEKLCEKACCAEILKESINIAGLQKFACVYGKEHNLEKFPTSNKTKGKVAVVGAGPAGVSCAAELAKLDYDVTIFEKEKECGGVPRWNIPACRLPQEALDDDMRNLQDLGVSIKYDSGFATYDAMVALLTKDFQAVFIGVGLACSVKFPLLQDYTNALAFNYFLRQVKIKPDDLKLANKNVIVIGGGSSAMDVACAASSLGADVTVIYRRTELEMPAYEEEIELAHQAGVEFRTNANIVEVIADGKQVNSIKGIGLKWLKPGSRNSDDAKPVPGTEFNLNVDLIVQAIGSRPAAELTNLPTNVAGVFCGGDIVNGGDTVVQAVGEGKQAAKSIDEYIRGMK
jgi:dihydropyrimidine dehydrogenase (NAD+) subunit PreT